MREITDDSIDWKFVEDHLEAGCSGREIASQLGMHYSTFYNKCKLHYNEAFEDITARFKEKGDACLRKVQYDKAKSGDNINLIWLGKNRLKQSDDPNKNPSNNTFIIKVGENGIATGFQIPSTTVSITNNPSTQ